VPQNGEMGFCFGLLTVMMGAFPFTENELFVCKERDEKDGNRKGKRNGLKERRFDHYGIHSWELECFNNAHLHS